MPADVVVDDEGLAFCVADPSLEELGQLGVVKGPVYDHPMGLALVGHRGDHRQLVVYLPPRARPAFVPAGRSCERARWY